MKRKTKRFIIAGGIIFAAACLFLPHICSVNLTWDGIGTLRDFHIPAKLPRGAAAVKEKISPMLGGTVMGFVLAGITIAVILFLKKTGRTAHRNLRRIAVLSALSSMCSMPLHELMHAWACPAGSEVHLGIVPEKLLGYAVTNVPMNLAQYTAYMTVPAVLIGILPLLGAVFFRKAKHDAATFLFIYGMLGLVQTAPDWFGLFPVLRDAPADAVIQISNGITYWFLR